MGRPLFWGTRLHTNKGSRKRSCCLPARRGARGQLISELDPSRAATTTSLQPEVKWRYRGLRCVKDAGAAPGGAGRHGNLGTRTQSLLLLRVLCGAFGVQKCRNRCDTWTKLAQASSLHLR